MKRGLLNYQAWKLQRLANPEFAASYLNDVVNNSPELLLIALKNVAQAREMTSVAKEAGIARESLHRALSEQGNPTWDTLSAVMNVLGLRFQFVPAEAQMPRRPQPFSCQTATLASQEMKTQLTISPTSGSPRGNALRSPRCPSLAKFRISRQGRKPVARLGTSRLQQQVELRSVSNG